MKSKRENYLINVDDLLKHSQGRGLEIIRALVPSLSDAVAAAERGSPTHVRCPFPASHSNSGGVNKFRLWRVREAGYNGSAICSCGYWQSYISLIMDVNAMAFKDVLELVNEHLGDPCGVREKTDSKQLSPDERKRRDEAAKKARIERESSVRIMNKEMDEKRLRQDQYFVYLLKKTWNESVSIRDPLAKPLWLYLKNLGINPSILSKCGDMRFHPALEYYCDGDVRGEYPALLSLYRDSRNQPINIHRTFLSPDGEKASLYKGEKAKRMMKAPSFVSYQGGAIKMMSHEGVLGVAEGIENAWSAYYATGIPTWPTYCDSMLSSFEIPDGVFFLVIWADKDISLAGELAAGELQDRAHKLGIPCQIMLPRFKIPEGQHSIDWNDVLMQFGKVAFPQPNLRLAKPSFDIGQTA